MGEPIKLYDKNGKELTVYGPATMREAMVLGATLEKAKAEPQPKDAPKIEVNPADKPKGK